MKTIKVLIFAIAMVLSITSCLEEKPLENDKPGTPQSLLNIQNALISATGGNNPTTLKVGEWAYFRNYYNLYTGEFHPVGYRAAQVMGLGDGTYEYEDDNGNTVSLPTQETRVVTTEYDNVVEEGQSPPITLQKEWNCKFVKPPYYLWANQCDLPPLQNYWAFYPLLEPSEPVFFSLAKYKTREKLPEKMVKEGRCYNFENCEIDVTYLEYDMYLKDDAGTLHRIHYLASFSPDLPYLASNIKTCFDKFFEDINGVGHPGKFCQELVDFRFEL